MESKIIDLLSENNALTVNDIDSKLEINNIEETKKILKKMVDNLEITTTNKNKYILIENSKQLKGILSVSKAGYGFVKVKDHEDIYIGKNDMKGAINGDIVLIEMNKKSQKPSGRIVRIKNRDELVKVAEIRRNGNNIKVIMDDNKFPYKIVIKNNNLVDGMKITLKLDEMIDNNTYSASVVEILGHKDDPFVDLLSITKEYGIEKEFPKSVISLFSNVIS